MTSPSTIPPAILTTENLTVQIGCKTVCNDLSLNIQPGESWAILGMNGAGKTTLLHTLAGLRLPQSGSITLLGQALSQLSRREIAQKLGLLLQDFQDSFPGTVLETALIGRHPHLHAWQWESAEDFDLAKNTLATVDLSGFEVRQVLTLSGGERRRLGLATLLMQDPQLYLLDEPVNHLDLHHQHTLLTMLRDLVVENNKAMLMVLHDINLAMRYCDHALLLFEDGTVTHGDVHALLTADTLSQLYSHPVISIPGPQGNILVPV